jgi:hypothetical protein
VIYGVAHGSGKDIFLSELAEICSHQRLPFMLGGDFNILRFASVKNKEFKDNKHNELFNSIITLYELRELVMTGGLLGQIIINPSLENFT